MAHTVWVFAVSFFTGLKAADLIAFAGVIIAYKSAQAARIAGAAANEAVASQRAVHHEERRTSYYQLAVVDPSMEAIDVFRASTKLLLGQCADAIQRLGADSTIKAYREVTESSTVLFNAAYDDLQFGILVAVRSWQDPDLLGEVGSALTQLQDDVTATISRQLSGRREDSDGLRVLQERVSELLSVIVRYDRDHHAEDVLAPPATRRALPPGNA